MSKMKDIALEYEQAAEYVSKLSPEVLSFILSDPVAWIDRINDYCYSKSMERTPEE